jgi:hypothetical protein
VVRAQRGAERRRVAGDELMDVGIEHVGHHLQDGAVRRCAAGRIDRRHVHAHPR